MQKLSALLETGVCLVVILCFAYAGGINCTVLNCLNTHLTEKMQTTTQYYLFSHKILWIPPCPQQCLLFLKGQFNIFKLKHQTQISQFQLANSLSENSKDQSKLLLPQNNSTQTFFFLRRLVIFGPSQLNWEYGLIKIQVDLRSFMNI